mmetsp:Transcript_46960/g.92448  ORF Transcript_46960/g.92448 Transcript_46960/m.92448 type:complete len:229 (-) Transcript_46960:163-849(-)|eukprot:CAMPEP_0175106172 /NCGR_PEP_ID=MMETSP0086_2-20121207/11010_1 /TAXON_ID=136419 /ORGANISM="Unknown Unknown, Strain D1" /LENGTH=228 /DNA_ID=CAMNT_0016382395 /DNA_START=64 /DNA_END=750 /DNA_ORIENTATION=+
MKLELSFVSDLVCPWCVIGHKNLRTAISKLSDDLQINVVWRPFQLHPNISAEGYDKEALASLKFGGKDRAKRYFQRVVAAGKEVGFDFRSNKSKAVPNTLDGHRLLWLAEQHQDSTTQTAVAEKLFAAHFTQGRDISSHEVLASVAAECGLDQADVLYFLKSEAGRAEVLQQEQQARDMDIMGVPTIVVNGRYLLPGGQDPDTVVVYLKRLAKTIQQLQEEVPLCAKM